MADFILHHNVPVKIGKDKAPLAAADHRPQKEDVYKNMENN